MSSRWFIRLVFVTAAAIGGLSAGTAEADPSGRVARISFTSGSVAFRPGTMDEWGNATFNYPLTIGDHVWTDSGGRAELETGATVLRLAPATEVSILNLDDRTTQLRLSQGEVSVRVRAIEAGDAIEIDTPGGALSLLHPGLYRVDVNEAGDATTVTVRNGGADVTTSAADVAVHAGESATFAGADGSLRPSMQAAVAIDQFEDWCLTRDRRPDQVRAARYVSPETIGYEDLDANGAWETAVDYGAVWVPHVAIDWAPYRFGHWAWVEPWGWTWIDDAPWGFAPFHYGRWVYLPAGHWAWVPGTIVRRPVYAPALVAFVGGAGWSVGAASPVAWFPLGPRDVFVPAYRVTPGYVQRINAAHVPNVNVTTVNITNITYVNRLVPGAVTVVSRETFVRAESVGRAVIPVPREQIRAAAVVGMAAPVAPQRASIVGVAVPRAAPPATVVMRQVVVRSAPPPPPAPFRAREIAATQPDPAASVAPVAPAPRPGPDRHPLVRAVVAPHAPANAPAARAASPAAPHATASAQPPASPAAPQAATRQPPPAPNQPAAAASAPAHPQRADLAARHAQERAAIQARQEQERAALQAKHQQERQMAAPAQRAEMRQRQQQELQALQVRHKQEREAMQARQQEERARRER